MNITTVGADLAKDVITVCGQDRASKNDRNDAEAIAVAAREANMRFVTVKSTEQQGRLAVHRLRQPD